MVYKFRCINNDCGVVSEKAIPIADFDSSKDSKCPKCHGVAKFEFDGGPSVMTSGMSQAPLDVVIGKSAEKRWQGIHARQEQRDKVRREAGQTGLTQTGADVFQPISPEQKATRTEVRKAVDRDGFQPVED